MENIFFRKRRQILIDESEVTKTILVLQEFGININDTIAVGNCGWAKAPKCWFIVAHINDKTWYKILQKIKDAEITLLPETTGY